MFTDAHDFGFSPAATGLHNSRALQQAVDQGGTVVVSRPGVYSVARTVYVGSYTTIRFGNGVSLKKVDEEGPFSHVILNKGALSKTWDEGIVIEGLNLIVNGLDVREWQVFGLHGQLAFFYIKDLRVERFRCLDLGPVQYAIHICTFEDVTVNDAIIHGDKDGVHFGPGKRFLVSNCVFKCFDDAVALNAYDYDVGNPEAGWIEDGIVENCHDLDAGGWKDWEAGMMVQKSDTVVSKGRVYRVKADPDGRFYESTTRPAHESGTEILDGISWVMSQEEVTYTAGVRNVIFRDIFMRKPRTGFSIYFHNDRFFRAYYPGSPYPVQEQLTFDNIRILHDRTIDFLVSESPMDVLSITNSSLKDNAVRFRGDDAVEHSGTTIVNMIGCVFNSKGPMDLLVNEMAGKNIVLKTNSSVQTSPQFLANVVAGPGQVAVESDLSGLP